MGRDPKKGVQVLKANINLVSVVVGVLIRLVPGIFLFSLWGMERFYSRRHGRKKKKKGNPSKVRHIIREV